MQSLQKAAKDMGLIPMGEHPDLGLASFRLNNNEMLYAHCTPKDKNKTTIALAPGLPHLEDKDPSELPMSVINELLDQLDHHL